MDVLALVTMPVLDVPVVAALAKVLVRVALDAQQPVSGTVGVVLILAQAVVQLIVHSIAVIIATIPANMLVLTTV